MADITMRNIRDVLDGNEPVFRLESPTNLMWPLSQQLCNSQTGSNLVKRTFSIAILDSSFNPPTLAHKFLLFNTLHSVYPLQRDRLPNQNDKFDAGLVLLSVNNADKGRFSEEDISQRLRWMQILSNSVSNDLFTNSESIPGLAVGITNCAKFLDKAEILQKTLSQLVSSLISSLRNDQNDSNLVFDGQIRLYFIMGFDTVIRFFDSKYYEGSLVEALSGFFDDKLYGSRIICANRTQGIISRTSQEAIMQEFLNPENEATEISKAVKKYREFILELGGWMERDDLINISSSEVRQILGDHDAERRNDKQALFGKLIQKLPSEIASDLVKQNKS
ncbi:hypothetical protein HK096_002313 [Nowakowskiella sp. JEL0078]|nr:hypothetical protein HK096_002313 [Nowakowskiella sp. JEL0078]